jgi:excisionase family DNA binding protein
VTAPRLLSLSEVAGALGVSRRSVERLTAAGRIRTVYPVPGRVMVTERELAAYVASLEGRRVA